jgi:hypothetical protein
MAAYDFRLLQPSPSNSPKLGNFWLYAELDFSKNPLATGDSAKIMNLKDKWIVADSYWRQTVASTAANTYDIGTVDATGAYASTDAGILSGGASSAGDWAQGIPDRDANQIICSVDRIVFVENLTADVTDGILEVLLEIIAGPDDNEPVDMRYKRVGT